MQNLNIYSNFAYTQILVMCTQLKSDLQVPIKAYFGGNDLQQVLKELDLS